MKVAVTFKPMNKTVQVSKGTSIMGAASRAGVTIRSRCGGKAGCLMCKVNILNPESVFPATEKERRKLGDHPQRLACQTKVRADAVVEVPDDPLKAAIQAQLKKKHEEDSFW